jgi:hypothetical protein
MYLRRQAEQLRVLMAHDQAVESWLHHQIGPAYDALKADTFRAVTVDHVRVHFAAELAKTLNEPFSFGKEPS